MTSSIQTKRQIPITELGLEYEAIKGELMPLLDKILRSGAYVLGPELTLFEKELASYLGAAHAVGVNSGTDAILLALRALDIGPGDEVIVPAMSFFATVEPVVQVGAKPVFVDIDPVSFALDANAVSAKVTSKSKAILAVHLYGHPADLKALSELSRAKGIPLIEDMAQAIGSSYEGKKSGSWGDMACLSFYPTKNLGACGDAGAVMTSSTTLAERLRTLRNHGAKVKYHHDEIAYNSRLDELQAAILRLKLRHLNTWNDKRRLLAAEYSAALKGLPISLPQELPGRHHVYHLYSIQSEHREELRAYLNGEGISTGLHYPITLPMLPALAFLNCKAGDFPISERLAKTTLSLPLYPFMTSADIQFVSDAVHEFYKARV